MCDVQCYDQPQLLVNASPEVDVKVTTMGCARFTKCLAAKGSPRYAAAPPTMKPVLYCEKKNDKTEHAVLLFGRAKGSDKDTDTSHFMTRKKDHLLHTVAHIMSVVCLLSRKDHGLGICSIY